MAPRIVACTACPVAKADHGLFSINDVMLNKGTASLETKELRQWRFACAHAYSAC